VAPKEKAMREDKSKGGPPDVPVPVENVGHLIIPGSVRENACEILFTPDIDGVCLPSMLLDAICKVNGQCTLYPKSYHNFFIFLS